MSPWHSVKTQKKGVCCSSATLIALCWHSTSRRLSSRNFDKASLRQPDYLGSKEQKQVMWLLPLSQGRQNNQSQSFVPPASWAEAGRYPRREEQIRARSLQALASTLHRCYPPAPSQAPGQSTLPQIHQFPSYYECWGVWGLYAVFSWSNHSKGTALVRALCSGNQPMAITCRVSHLCQGAVPRKLVLTMLVQVTKA